QVHWRIIAKIEWWVVMLGFRLKRRDVDCDFRLMRRSSFERIRLASSSGTICIELVKSLQNAGMTFAEAPVHHYHRAYGKSQFFNFKRLFKTLIDLSRLWWRLMIRRDTRVVHPMGEPGRSVEGRSKEQ